MVYCLLSVYPFGSHLRCCGCTGRFDSGGRRRLPQWDGHVRDLNVAFGAAEIQAAPPRTQALPIRGCTELLGDERDRHRAEVARVVGERKGLVQPIGDQVLWRCREPLRPIVRDSKAEANNFV